ncbi:globin domain-containing protein [Candidatus Arthromitus sp. SFB-rat-Yit]|uniref:globin domain-containing protein n=1 Tax=Candidatus Arthromitus sp. SFB-rat-Yit TaxID=1041504 RepID=UPI000227A288|nr:globin domain-containing protein [Candidatus Arthromitus sp. SFB-rat-Yit]BAK81424.1 hemoglobin [Candidatus Arthromitus sp. SFB-rat-Yit]
MLDFKVKSIIKDCVPVLRERGVELTENFYDLMFTNNPEVRPLFDEDRQKSGKQAKALAASLLAVAQNIDDLEKILPTVKKIGESHVKAKVLPEHYPIVGKNLLLAIKKTLGDAATDDVINAFSEVYTYISKIFIDVEKELYNNL